jgi:hypothetical protein
MIPLLIVIGLTALGGLAGLLYYLRRRHMSRWIITYVSQTPKRRSVRHNQDVHLLLCVADHYEPEFGNAPRVVRDARVESWVTNYPRLFGDFRDCDGRPPRHTFFYPVEHYHEAYLDALAGLCRQGFGEVEVHLHHDGDNAALLRQQLLAYKNLLADRHQLLAHDPKTGQVAYGFIHGN